MRRINEMAFYSIADAKKNFSSVVKATKEKEVIVTKNGKPVSVVVDYERFMKLMDFLFKVKDLYLMELGSKDGFDELKELTMDFFIEDSGENSQEV